MDKTPVVHQVACLQVNLLANLLEDPQANHLVAPLESLLVSLPASPLANLPANLLLNHLANHPHSHLPLRLANPAPVQQVPLHTRLKAGVKLLGTSVATDKEVSVRIIALITELVRLISTVIASPVLMVSQSGLVLIAL